MKLATVSFAIFFCIVIPRIVQGQKPTGIFISRNFNDQCPNKKELLNRREYFCLEEKPIVGHSDFAAISDIYSEPETGRQNIDIFLTKKGSKIISAYANGFINGEIGVVVKGRLVSIINVGGAINITKITVWDKFDSKSIKWIHKNLVASISNSE